MIQGKEKKGKLLAFVHVVFGNLNMLTALYSSSASALTLLIRDQRQEHTGGLMAWRHLVIIRVGDGEKGDSTTAMSTGKLQPHRLAWGPECGCANGDARTTTISGSSHWVTIHSKCCTAEIKLKVIVMLAFLRKCMYKSSQSIYRP